MNTRSQIDNWIEEAKQGELGWTQLAERILAAEHPAAALHQPDIDRIRRCGFGEVIFGQNKTTESIIAIAQRLLGSSQTEVLVTRCDQDKLPNIAELFHFSRYDLAGKTLRIGQRPIQVVNPDNAAKFGLAQDSDSVCVLTAGSTDLPVAREALETLRWMGVNSGLLSDVGVAGPYRLLPHLERLRRCSVVVVCAGMEGALASVMGGLVGCPVIAVPTSVGYGANFQGVTTLLSMMSSCAAGVTVVNIDAGFKGGYVAGLIATGYGRQQMMKSDLS
jgi:pyridinium-3,5-biscarboxylic acid mononucleotide synthase